jgi:hypothetical protein
MAHLAASFELAIHEFLLRAGCQILEVEPAIESTAKSPDFLVRGSAGNDFFVEATLAAGMSREDAAAEMRLHEAYTAIDSVKSPDFLLSIETAGAPERPVSLRKFRSRLERWLESLNHDEIATAWQAHLPVPSFPYSEHGVSFAISPIPRKETRGEGSGRVIAAFTLSSSSLQAPPADAIRSAVTTKAGRYGQLPLPYVVAVNSHLYGTAQMLVSSSAARSSDYQPMGGPSRHESRLWDRPIRGCERAHTEGRPERR